MSRKRHQLDDVEKAIQFAEKLGWRYQRVGRSAHAWGRLLCPLQSREGCALSIWSTPRNSWIHAKQIVKRINECPHKLEE